MDKLKLFEIPEMEDDFKIGKTIWDLTAKYPQEKLGTIIRTKTDYRETDARRGYWTYVFMTTCNLKNELQLRNKLDILKNYKTYLFQNYVKVLKAKVGEVNNINLEFRNYFIDLFLKTYTLQEKELREYLKQEVENITQENLFTGFQLFDLRKEIDNLTKENEKLKETNKNIEIINETFKKINEDLRNKLEETTKLEDSVENIRVDIVNFKVSIAKYLSYYLIILGLLLAIIK